MALGIIAIVIALITIGVKDYQDNMAEKSTIVFPPPVSSSSTSDSTTAINTNSSTSSNNAQVIANESQDANTNSYN